jgi:hypothetical protein
MAAFAGSQTVANLTATTGRLDAPTPVKPVAGHSPSRRLWRKNFVDQLIIRSFERVDESDALQDEPILQILSK